MGPEEEYVGRKRAFQQFPNEGNSNTNSKKASWNVRPYGFFLVVHGCGCGRSGGCPSSACHPSNTSIPVSLLYFNCCRLAYPESSDVLFKHCRMQRPVACATKGSH
mmetsp:Transcript_25845/g.56894  ORF Transcript_25845/g.56894 Transcript_25845/m.56894 type:complete len:106 (-) Transcript_25845:25-342(-)